MRSRYLVSALSIALFAGSAIVAQEVVQPLPGSTDADALAADMRRLAANPRDVDALVDAASLSLRLGDMRAAAALLARAENVDPRNPRVKAGQGAILVQSERPGEALRYFAQAQGWGLDASDFAAERALAYDLTGQPERAQRDYRVALRERPGDDETIRNYALSLGISGQRAPALALLEPLVRKSDRAAWRAQAFVLAMTGDVGGASRIAATMMPGGAAGLSAFFERLPSLPATDRAFAVHFGEVRATPERIADARMAPPLTPLAREAGSAALLASNATPSAPTRRNRRDDRRTQIAATQPATPIPAETRASVAMPTARAAPVAAVPRATTPPPAAVPTTVVPEPQRPVVVAIAQSRPAAQPGRVASVTTASIAPVAAAPAVVVPETGAPAAAAVTALTTPPPATEVAVVDTPPATAVSTAPPAAPSRSFASTRASEDAILARIVAGLSIPAAELGVQGPPRREPAPAPVSAPAPASAPVAEPTPAPTVVATPAPRPVAPRPDPAIAAQAEADRIAADKRAAARALADKRAAERKAAADKKALAEKKAAAAAKALADKEAAEAQKVARANPERIWVQVAGGAYEGDLPKAYGAVKAKAPAVFGSRGGWTTPLRATNRVLTGPFKTDAEARAFVNDLKKEGVSAFTFTSDAGQPVKRLGAKGASAIDDDEPDPKAAKPEPKKKAESKAQKKAENKAQKKATRRG